MSHWALFGRETPEEREERDAVQAQIAAAEKAALDACRALRAIAEQQPVLAGQAASMALTHIATLAGVEGQALFRRSTERL